MTNIYELLYNEHIDKKTYKLLHTIINSVHGFKEEYGELLPCYKDLLIPEDKKTIYEQAIQITNLEDLYEDLEEFVGFLVELWDDLGMKTNKGKYPCVLNLKVTYKKNEKKEGHNVI